MNLYNSLFGLQSFLNLNSSTSPAYTSQKESSVFPSVLAKTVMEKENREEAIGFLKQLFGERVVGEVLARHPFEGPFTRDQIQIILCSIGARATVDDLKQLHHALQVLEPISRDAEPFLVHLTMEEIVSLSDMAKRCSFEELDSDGLDQLLGFFRKQLGENGERVPLAMPSEELDSPYTTNQNYKEDKKLLETFKEYAGFDCNASLKVSEKEACEPETQLVVGVEDLAVSEYFSRGLAYAPLRKGMVVPSPTKSQKPEYFQVEGSIENNGFGYFLLSKMHSEDPKKFHVLFRGTVPTDISSISHCFGVSVGLKPFSENAHEILAEMKDALAQYQNTTMEFNGHSQGGSLAQHALEMFLNEFNQPDSPVHSANHIRLSVWNSPSILEKEAESIAVNLEGMAKNAETMNAKVQFAYNIIAPDIVHTFGELLAGYYLKSFNASRQIICFESTGSGPYYEFHGNGPLGHHCSPILTKGGGHKVVSVHTENREKFNQNLKAIAYLTILIRHYEADQKGDGEIDADELHREFSQLDSIEADFGVEFKLAMHKMDLEALKKLKEQLEAMHLQDIERLEKESQELAKAMLLSTYKNLSQLDQYTGGAIVNIAKDALYDMLNPQVSPTGKVKTAAKIGAIATAGTIALYGVGAAVAANPITAGLLVTGAGLAYGAHKVKKTVFG